MRTAGRRRWLRIAFAFKKGHYIFLEGRGIGTETPSVNCVVPFDVVFKVIHSCEIPADEVMQMVQTISEARFPYGVVRVKDRNGEMFQVIQSETQRLANLLTLMKPEDGGRSVLVSRVAGFAGLFGAFILDCQIWTYGCTLRKPAMAFF